MKIRIATGYLLILVLSFVLYSVKPARTVYYSALPVLLLAFPIIAGHRIKLRFTIKDFLMGLAVSAVILIPYHVLFGGTTRNFSFYYILFQLLVVAFPEEFFFRGFIQDSMGRNIKSVLFVSLLFAAAHLPKAYFAGEWISLLSFFPSVVMGWLYMKTDNILPGTIFHLLANLAY